MNIKSAVEKYCKLGVGIKNPLLEETEILKMDYDGMMYLYDTRLEESFTWNPAAAELTSIDWYPVGKE